MTDPPPTNLTPFSKKISKIGRHQLSQHVPIIALCQKAQHSTLNTQHYTIHTQNSTPLEHSLKWRDCALHIFPQTITYLANDKAVCRTAPATSGLSNIDFLQYIFAGPWRGRPTGGFSISVRTYVRLSVRPYVFNSFSLLLLG